MRGMRLLGLILLLCAAGPVAAQSRLSPKQWTLRMLPTSGSVEYELTTTDTTVIEAAGHTTQRVTPLHRLVTRRVTPVHEPRVVGQLDVEQSDREVGITVGKGTISLPGVRAPSHFRVGTDGQGANGARLDLALPGTPVALGARWSAVTPASRLTPFALTTAYHLEREEVVAGRPCLIITAETTGEGSGGPYRAKGTYSGKARLAFDPRAGLVVRAIRDAHLTIVEPPDQRGPRRKENRIASRMELRAK